MKTGSRQTTLQTRIVVFYFTSFFSVFLLLLAGLYVFQNSLLNNLLNEQLIQRARLKGHIWIEESGKGTKDLAERMDRDMGSSRSFIAIYDTGGRLLYRRNAPHAAPRLSERSRRETLRSGAGVRTESRDGLDFKSLIVPFRRHDRLAGFVFLEVPLDGIRKFNRAFLLAVPIVALALFAAVLILGKLLVRRILRSIGAVTHATHRVSAEHLDERVDTTGLEAEFHPLADNFNRMCDRLQDSFTTLRRFASDASHELRTPLAVMKTNLEVTLQREREPVEYVEAFSSALDTVNRMGKTISALLHLTRSESGEDVFRKDSLSLRGLVREVADFIAPLAEDKEIRMELDLRDEALFHGDEEWLRHLVFNLLDNSIKYGRPSDAVHVSLEREDGNYLLKVSDTGPGISAEHLPHIFERFYRAPGAEGQAGTGLGLALCRWVVRGHGGGIHVRSEPGRGTVFAVSLPAENGK